MLGINSMRIRSSGKLSIPAQRALRKLGADIRDARRRRRIPTALMSERARISRMTLAKVENGDASASIAAYANVLFVLGMIDRLAGLADSGQDSVGLALEEERLPKRIRLPKPRRPKAGD
jgi:transcriptional regulator with XRE-family HTH domain